MLLMDSEKKKKKNVKPRVPYLSLDVRVNVCFISFLFSSSGLLKTCQAICSDFVVVKLKSLKIIKWILVHQRE